MRGFDAPARPVADDAIVLREARLIPLLSALLLLAGGLGCGGLLLAQMADGRLDGTSLLVGPIALTMMWFGAGSFVAGVLPPARVILNAAGIYDLRTVRGLMSWSQIRRAAPDKQVNAGLDIVFETYGAGIFRVDVATLDNPLDLTLSAIERFAPHVAHRGFLKGEPMIGLREKVDLSA